MLLYNTTHLYRLDRRGRGGTFPQPALSFYLSSYLLNPLPTPCIRYTVYWGVFKVCVCEFGILSYVLGCLWLEFMSVFLCVLWLSVWVYVFVILQVVWLRVCDLSFSLCDGLCCVFESMWLGFMIVLLGFMSVWLGFMSVWFWMCDCVVCLLL